MPEEACALDVLFINNPAVAGAIVATSNPHRWTLDLAYNPDGGQHISEFTPERCRELVRAAVGIADLPLNVVNVAPWNMEARVAQRFGDGRVFLVGDAAHAMPPTGGYGLNSGVQDVHDLAWKLAAVLLGWAGAGLLATYEAERLPVARFNTDQSLINGAEVAKAGGQPNFARFQGIGIALGYTYTSSAIVPDGSTAPVVADPVVTYMPSAHPCGRAPHVWVQRDRAVSHSSRRSVARLSTFGDVHFAPEEAIDYYKVDDSEHHANTPPDESNRLPIR